MDLTKIDKPLGELDDETAVALFLAWRRGEEMEYRRPHDPHWFPEWLSRGLDRNLIYSLAPEPLRDISLPWAVLDKRWQWAARDENGECFLYTQEPKKGKAVWIVRDGSCLRIDALFADFDPGNKPWDESLIQRPEGV